VGLIAGVLEAAGIPTVCLSTFDAIMGQVAPPRWLTVPYPLGFPLGRANEPELQLEIIRRAFELLDRGGPGPVQEDYLPDGASFDS
jgi:hypothetical protein